MQEENRNSGLSRNDEEVPLILDLPDQGEEPLRLADEEDDGGGGFRLTEDDEGAPIRVTGDNKGDSVRLTSENGEEPISLVDEEPESGESKVRQFGRGAIEHATHEFRRQLNVTGQGATRCRIFHSRIAVDALEGTEERINDWLDADNIEVKHVGHMIGTMEGKTARPNVILIVWY